MTLLSDAKDPTVFLGDGAPLTDIQFRTIQRNNQFIFLKLRPEGRTEF